MLHYDLQDEFEIMKGVLILIQDMQLQYDQKQMKFLYLEFTIR
jgi:hypothetical protein